MTNTLKISLKPNEKIYINGAVIRVDRKVTIELMNDVQFLLESHVIQADQASTPLRQLYFVVQIMLINPAGAGEARGRVAAAHGANQVEPHLSAVSVDRVAADALLIFEDLRAAAGIARNHGMHGGDGAGQREKSEDGANGESRIQRSIIE